MPRERKSASAVDYASAPAKRGRRERKRRLAVDGRWVGSLIACAGCVWSQQVEVLELAGDDNAVARALFLKRAEVVREWELHVAPCEHGLEYLLDRLLSVKRDDRVGHAINGQQLASGRLVLGRAGEQETSKIPRRRHQAASSRPSDSAA